MSRHTVAGRARRAALPAALLLVAGLALAACGGGSPATPAAPSVDVAALTIAPSDIPLPGFSRTGSQKVSQTGVDGLATLFTNADDSRELGDTIAVFPDAAAAATTLKTATAAAQAQLTGVTTMPARVGDAATLVLGMQDSKSATVLLFTQGRAFVTLEFDSAPGDPVPAEVVTAVGTKQAALIAAGLR